MQQGLCVLRWSLALHGRPILPAQRSTNRLRLSPDEEIDEGWVFSALGHEEIDITSPKVIQRRRLGIQA
jgi:hypothetical protein